MADEESVSFVPLGLETSVTLRLGTRPRCCPDLKCMALSLGMHYCPQEQLDSGFSGSCWGYCGKDTFTFNGALHENDLSHCIITPLKGVIRYFERYSDLECDLAILKRFTSLLRPLECSECKTSNEHQTVIIYDTKPLCLGCAVRLGVVKFSQENVGTARVVYY